MKKRPFSANFGWKARPSRPSSESVSTFTLNSGPDDPSATDAHFAAPPFSSTTQSADSPGGNWTSVGESNPRATGFSATSTRRRAASFPSYVAGSAPAAPLASGTGAALYCFEEPIIEMAARSIDLQDAHVTATATTTSAGTSHTARERRIRY